MSWWEVFNVVMKQPANITKGDYSVLLVVLTLLVFSVIFNIIAYL